MIGIRVVAQHGVKIAVTEVVSVDSSISVFVMLDFTVGWRLVRVLRVFFNGRFQLDINELVCRLLIGLLCLPKGFFKSRFQLYINELACRILIDLLCFSCILKFVDEARFQGANNVVVNSFFILFVKNLLNFDLVRKSEGHVLKGQWFAPFLLPRLELHP
jgi:hypothetical protein